MSISPKIRTSQQAYDGALPIVVNLGRAAFASTAQDNLAAFVVPCDSTIVQANIRVLVAATASAAKISIGDQTASGAVLSAYPMNGKAAGAYDIITASQFTKRKVSKGDYVKVKLPAATAVGSFAGSLVLMPTVTQE